MDEGCDEAVSLEQVAAAYAGLLAGFGAFTLRRWVEVEPEEYLGTADVYRSDDPAEVGELRRLLAARPSNPHCLCMGTALISLEGSEASAELSVHHGESVRWQRARSGDLELEHGRELAVWLAARGVADVRDEMDESERQKAQFEAEQQAWVAAMPAAVLPYREAVLELDHTGAPPSPEMLGELSHAFSSAEPDDERRIRALLSWHGSGFSLGPGGWCREFVPERLLLAESSDSLLAILSGGSLTTAETVGAIRLIIGWPDERAAELRRLPTVAWDHLTAAAEAAGDHHARDQLALCRAESEGRW